MKNNIEKFDLGKLGEPLSMNDAIQYNLAKKMNDLIDLTEERTKARDKQIDDIHQDLIIILDRIEKIEKELKIGK